MHGIDPGAAAPIGAAFKLYVLDALGQSAAAGTVGWTQPLTVTTQLKSLPAGDLQNDPDGTQVSVLEAAAAMMSVSDNTATDMLINLVGRSSVEAALAAAGMASPALDQPLLTTREIFVLKLRQWPALATRYVAADESSRRALLAGTVDQAPLPAVAAAGSWTAPRDIDSLEYFASASDLCRAYASLATLARQPGLDPIGEVLSLNDNGLALDPAQWKSNLVQGRVRARRAGHGLPGHDQDRAQLCRHRAGRGPLAAHRRSRRDTGHAVGHQGRVHAGGARLTRARQGRCALDTTMAAAHDGVAGRPG